MLCLFPLLASVLLCAQQNTQSVPARQSSAAAASEYGWKQVSFTSSSRVGFRGWNQIIYDPVQKKILAWMAVSGCGDPWSNAVWTYDTSSATFERKTWTGSGDLAADNCAKPTFVSNPKSHPGDRHPYHQMTYDTKRGRMWIFGGVADGGKCDASGPGTCGYVDTWYYDSKDNAWTCTDDGGGCNNDVSKMTSPGRRTEGAMVYDAANDMVVFFGSLRVGNPTNDTWHFSPSQNKWTKVSAQGSPPPSEGDSLVYDSVDHKVVMFGGRGVIDRKVVRFMNQVWIYDAGREKWTDPHPAEAPPGAVFPPLAYDPTRNVVVYYNAPGSTWVYSVPQNRWTNLNLPGGPVISIPAAVSMTYDPGTDTFVLMNAVHKEIWYLKLPPGAAPGGSAP